MKKEKSSIYILYPDGILAYAPTVLNLYDLLSASYDVTIYSYVPDKYFNSPLVEDRNVIYLQNPGWPKRIIFAALYELGTRFFHTPKVGRFKFKRQMNLLWRLRFSKKPDAMIAIDLPSLWIAQKLSHHVHFLSLEIYENDPLARKIDKDNLRSVIIQSEVRYKYLFPDDQLRVFYIQNAPVVKPIEIPKDRERLIYNGTAIPEFGIYQCVEYIKRFPGESLTIKGATPLSIRTDIETNYNSLFESGKICIDSMYLDSSQLISYLSKFKIGFCFYDLTFEKINTFNYITAPSGKMFAYLAAGVPVIGNKIEGLKILEEFKAGILIDEISAEKIDLAVREIESNYQLYCSNALAAAKHYSFDKQTQPFLEFLQTELERV